MGSIKWAGQGNVKGNLKIVGIPSHTKLPIPKIPEFFVALWEPKGATHGFMEGYHLGFVRRVSHSSHGFLGRNPSRKAGSLDRTPPKDGPNANLNLGMCVFVNDVTHQSENTDETSGGRVSDCF